ncbi:MAG TPA: S53 family peptidase [Terriglobales bacterium]
MKPSVVLSVVIIMLCGALCTVSAQTASVTPDGRPIVIPPSSIPHPGHIHTNYFFADPASWNPDGPPTGFETPGSLACVYKLVPQVAGCPIGVATTVPTGGVGAIAIVDAGDYPTARFDLKTFSDYFGIPYDDANFKVIYATKGNKKPQSCEITGWCGEETLDIEWAHAMAPAAKLFLVESELCTTDPCNTDPTWNAVRVASQLVAENGGGVISMSWGDDEWAQEVNFDHWMTTPGVVYFAASGDGGIGQVIHPAVSPNVVAVGGTYFEREKNGDFKDEVYFGGGGGISQFEPRPSFQDSIEKIVGDWRATPDVASDFCCGVVYSIMSGGWGAVGGTSWASPTFAGISDAAGLLKKSSFDEHREIYSEYNNPKLYPREFFDITQGDSACVKGWNVCGGIGSPRTYFGK